MLEIKGLEIRGLGDDATPFSPSKGGQGVWRAASGWAQSPIGSDLIFIWRILYGATR
jgi:hypothetical protein